MKFNDFWWFFLLLGKFCLLGVPGSAASSRTVILLSFFIESSSSCLIALFSNYRIYFTSAVEFLSVQFSLKILIIFFRMPWYTLSRFHVSFAPLVVTPCWWVSEVQENKVWRDSLHSSLDTRSFRSPWQGNTLSHEIKHAALLEATDDRFFSK